MLVVFPNPFEKWYEHMNLKLDHKTPGSVGMNTKKMCQKHRLEIKKSPPSSAGTSGLDSQGVFLLLCNFLLANNSLEVGSSSESEDVANTKKPTTLPVNHVKNLILTGEQKMFLYTLYIYVNWLRLILGPCFGRWDIETGKRQDAPHPHPTAVPSSPPAIGVTCFRTTMSCSFLAISSGICHQSRRLAIHALPKVDTSHPHPCVACVSTWSAHLYFSQVSEKKTTILTYHHNAHKAKVCFGMVFFVHLNGQRSVFSTWKQISETFETKKAPFRFPTSGVRFLPVVAPYPSLPIAGIRFREKRQAHLYVGFQDP